MSFVDLGGDGAQPAARAQGHRDVGAVEAFVAPAVVDGSVGGHGRDANAPGGGLAVTDLSAALRRVNFPPRRGVTTRRAAGPWLR